MSKKVLVIGANGFLGNEILHQCLTRGWETDAVYHHNKQHIPSSCASFPSDKLPVKAYDFVFVATGNFTYAVNELQENVLFNNTVFKTYLLSRIVFVSSISVYGTHAGTISENSSYNQPTPYGLSKLASEFMLSDHPDHVIIRLGSLYGPRMNDTLFVKRMIAVSKATNIITVYGTGARKQNYLHVTDAAQYAVLAALTPSAKLVLATDSRSYSNMEVAETVKKIHGNCVIEQKNTDTSPSFEFDNSVTNSLLNYTPKVPLEKGLEEMFSNV